MQPSLISERLGRYLSVKMTERNPAFVAAHRTEKRLKTEKARLMEGWRDSVDCWLSDVGKTKQISVWLYIIPSTEQRYKEIISFGFCLQFAFYDREKSRSRFLELWAEPTKGGRKHPNLSLVGVSALVKRAVWGTGEERVRDRRTERQMDWKMIYPDLGSTLRTVKGGKRGEVAVVMGKGERNKGVDNNGGLGDGSGEINNIPWQIHSGRLWKCINLQN